MYNGGITSYLNGGGSGGGITVAQNGLTLSDPSTVELGGTLIQNTEIINSGFNLAITGLGKVGIGTTTPDLKLTLDNDGGIVAKGAIGDGEDLATTGLGERMMWIPKKGAFRAGGIAGNGVDGVTEWNNASIGTYSAAFGVDNKANGYGSFAVGEVCAASSAYAIAMGYSCIVEGTCDFSTAIGFNNIIHFDGNSSVALGRDNTVRANSSVAVGRGNTIAIAATQRAGAFGYLNNVTGVSGVAIGNQVTAAGAQSVAIGNGNGVSMQVNGTNVLGLGMGSDRPTLVITPGSGANTYGQVAIGFEIGVDSPNARLDILGGVNGNNGSGETVFNVLGAVGAPVLTGTGIAGDNISIVSGDGGTTAEPTVIGTEAGDGGQLILSSGAGGTGTGNNADGGDGGDTYLLAGNGGNANIDGVGGDGGDIYIRTGQPGLGLGGGDSGSNGNVILTTEGSGFHINETGPFARMGVATLVGGTVTVTNARIKPTSRVFLTGQNSSGTHGELTVSARSLGNDFTITSTSATDTRDVAWFVMDPVV